MVFHRIPGRNRPSLTTKSRIHQTLAPSAIIILVMLFITRFLNIFSPTASAAWWWVQERWRKSTEVFYRLTSFWEFQNLPQISLGNKKNIGRKHLDGGKTKKNLNFLNTATPFSTPTHSTHRLEKSPLSCGPTINTISKKNLDLGSHSTTLSDHKSGDSCPSEVESKTGD